MIVLNLQDLVPDMNLFYAQYASIEPWLKKKNKLVLGEKQMYQTEKERDKLVGKSKFHGTFKILITYTV